MVGGAWFLSQGQESLPANGHCGFDSPVTGQPGPNFPRAANPAPRCFTNINGDRAHCPAVPTTLCFPSNFQLIKKIF